MTSYEKQAEFALINLKNLADKYDVVRISSIVLDNSDFQIWSGSSRPDHHHYGDCGLIVHINEVVNLCISNNKILNSQINEKLLFLAAIYHDYGKIWDYQKEYGIWGSTQHKYRIHHISRSAIEWVEAAKQHNLSQSDTNEVLHAILAHHGLREWGSPVKPDTAMAWMLHLCDALSARMNDV